MLEEPKIKKVDKRDKQLPQNFEQLIEMYDIEKIWPYIKRTIDYVNNDLEKIKVSPTEPTTNEKVWIQKGKNLFNKNTALIGFWVKNGQPEYTSDKLTNVLSSYIKVKPNTTYTISGCIIGLWTCVYSYNENKTYYDEIAYTNTSEILTFTTGENDYYIRVAFGEGLPTIDLMQIEQGSTATEYEEYAEKKIWCKNDNGEFEEFINAENMPSIRKISYREFFDSLNYALSEFEAYQYGNIVNIQRLVISNVGDITATTQIGKINPKYYPKGNKPVRVLGSSGGVAIDYICFVETEGFLINRTQTVTKVSNSVYVFNSSYTIN